MVAQAKIVVGAEIQHLVLRRRHTCTVIPLRIALSKVVGYVIMKSRRKLGQKLSTPDPGSRSAGQHGRRTDPRPLRRCEDPLGLQSSTRLHIFESREYCLPKAIILPEFRPR